MDLWDTVYELHLERERLNKLIAVLERMKRNDTPSAAARRGRKNMSASERKEVSDRMKAWWAARKKSGKSATAGK